MKDVCCLNGFNTLRVICLRMCGGGLSAIFRIGLWGRPRLANFLYVPHLITIVTFGSSEGPLRWAITKLTASVAKNLFSYSEYSPSVFLLAAPLLLGLILTSLGHSKQLSPYLGLVQVLPSNPTMAQ